MFDPANTIRKLVATMLVAAAAAFVVPAAYTWDGPPDAIDRYNNPATLTWDGPPDAIDRFTGADVTLAHSGFQGPPDAIDRYVGADVTSAHTGFQGSPDALDRYNSPAIVSSDGSPDAIDRYRENRQWAVLATTRPGFQGNPDAIDRYLGRIAAPAASVTVSDGFAWNEFGIGAGAMLGAMLLLAGIGLGALAMRHRSGSLSTS